jgi:hypothetical protein
MNKPKQTFAEPNDLQIRLHSMGHVLGIAGCGILLVKLQDYWWLGAAFALALAVVGLESFCKYQFYSGASEALKHLKKAQDEKQSK